MFISREAEGVWLRELPVWVVDTLLSVPDWIASEDPAVKARLLPRAYEDDDPREREWREALGPSLEHLVASRTEVVRGDLQKMRVSLPDGDDVAGADDDEEFFARAVFEVWIPAGHVEAWVGTLQAGTHALFILEGLTAEDLDREGGEAAEPEPEKQVALLRLSVLQEVLVRLLEA